MSGFGGRSFSMQYIAVMLIVLSLIAASSSVSTQDTPIKSTPLMQEEFLGEVNIEKLFGDDDQLLEDELKASTFILKNHDLILELVLYLSDQNGEFEYHFPRVQSVYNFLISNNIATEHFRIIASSQIEDYQASLSFVREEQNES